MATCRTRIIGLGNRLMGDDGLGCRAIELLQQQNLPADCQLIDGGCGGLQLLPLLFDCQQLILIDAADFAATPGRFRCLGDLDRLPAAQNRLGHQFGLPELLQAARQIEQLPPTRLFLMQVKACRPGTDLTPEIERALPAFLAAIGRTCQLPAPSFSL